MSITENKHRIMYNTFEQVLPKYIKHCAQNLGLQTTTITLFYW